MTVGEKFRTARAQRGLTQKQVAEKLGISQPSYLEWERGDSVPNWSRMVSLSNILDFSLDWLAGKQKAMGSQEAADLIAGLREFEVFLGMFDEFARNSVGKEQLEYANGIISMISMQQTKIGKLIELAEKLEN